MSRQTVDVLARLSRAGVSIWLDDLSRERLTSGSLAQLVQDKHVVGVTTNPTIFARAITGTHAYDAQVRQLALRGVGADEALRAITTADVRAACDVLRPVYEATAGIDGRVSIEVDPRIAHDTERTIAEARALWWLVDRPNLFVKIPAAKQGLSAISACLAEAISINVTLIFSLARYDEVLEAFGERNILGEATHEHGRPADRCPAGSGVVLIRGSASPLWLRAAGTDPQLSTASPKMFRSRESAWWCGELGAGGE